MDRDARASDPKYGSRIPDGQRRSGAGIRYPVDSVTDPRNRRATAAGYAGSFSDGSDRNLAEAGLTYLVGGETQVDLNGRFELGSDDFFLGVGLARRVR